MQAVGSRGALNVVGPGLRIRLTVLHDQHDDALAIPRVVGRDEDLVPDADPLVAGIGSRGLLHGTFDRRARGVR